MEYGLIGGKLMHSYSCEIHEAIADYRYELMELKPDEVEPFLKEHAFCGINVTIPYKETVIPYLDEISEEAEKIGAVNTIVNRNGKLFGYNTDYAGMKALLQHAGIDPKGKKVLILGSGGTCKTAVSVLRDLGAEDIRIVSRKPESGHISYQEAYEKYQDTDLIVNTTPVGMYPEDEKIPIDLSVFPNLSAVIDAVYHPLQTELILEAGKRGISAEGGLYMLAAQAVYASALFTGKEASESMIERAYRAVFEKKRNIVLTGMPTSGKTTVGKILSGITGKQLIDCDRAFYERFHCTAETAIRSQGEEAFRKLESELISEIAKESGVVIATGGGAVLKAENVRVLRRNGTICFLDRPLDLLHAEADRPLSSSEDDLRKLYEARRPVYLSTADHVIDSSRAPEQIAANINEVLNS